MGCKRFEIRLNLKQTKNIRNIDEIAKNPEIFTKVKSPAILEERDKITGERKGMLNPEISGEKVTQLEILARTNEDFCNIEKKMVNPVTPPRSARLI